MKGLSLQVIHKLLDKSRQTRIKSDVWLVVAISISVVLPSVLLHTAAVAGVYANALAVITLVGLALLYDPARKIATAAAIIPVSFMVVISLPQITDFTRAVCLYSSILLLSLVYRYLFIHDSPDTKQQTLSTFRGSIGFLSALPQAIVIGQVLGGLAFILLPHVQPFSDVPIGLVLAVTVVFALIETVFFQGLLQSTAARTMSPRLAAILAAVLFISLSSITSLNTLIVNVLAGGSFAFLYYAKQNTLLTMLANVVMKLGFVYLITIA